MTINFFDTKISLYQVINSIIYIIIGIIVFKIIKRVVVKSTTKNKLLQQLLD